MKKTIAVVVLAVSSLAGCASQAKRYTPVDIPRSLLPALPAASEAEVDELLAERVAYAAPVRAAVVWLDGFAAHSSLPDAERVELMQSFSGKLSGGPVASVTVLPTQPAPNNALNPEPDGSADRSNLHRLLGAAARFQADVLVLVETESQEFVDWNPLALTYVALVPRLFVPGDSLSVYTSAEACAIDVRSGLFLGCAQGRGRARRALAFPMLREGSLRSLAVSATTQAIEDLPDPLRLQVGARIEAGATHGDRRRAIGVPYATR